MADVNISKYRASVVRSGSTPATPGFVVSEGQNPVEPAGSEQNHLPVTINATATGLAITTDQVLSGAGTVGQYIRGDGSLADFPASTGGGSSVSYYLNGSISQGTIGGVAYKELSKTPILGAGTQFTINADGYIASFLTDAGDPNLLEIPGGNWNFETYFSASSGGGSPTFYVELYKYDGSTFTLIASNSGSPELIAFGTNVNSYFSTLAVPTTALTLTDRLAIRYYVTHSGRTITLHTENNTLCQIITTFTTGLTALNGLTAQVQYFAVGTSGTDFNIASATQTHTFNLPTASASNRGALSSADWSTFNAKQNALTLTTTGSSGASTLVGATLNVPTYTLSGLGGVPTSRQLTINGTAFDLSADRSWSVGTVTSVGLSSATSGVTIGNTPVTGSGTITLAIATATSTQQGLLSSTDWSTFNNKQNALTLTTTGTSGAATLVGATLNIPQYQAAGTYVTSVTASSPLASSGGTTPNITIQQASGSQSGFLSSTDWTTFNNKQNALTNPVTGTGTTNYLAKFTGGTTIGNSQVFDNGTNVGIGTTSPSSILQANFSNATTYSSGVTGNGLTLYNTSTTNNQYVGLYFLGEPAAGNAGQATIYGITTGSGAMDLAFSTRGSSVLAERMRITSAGNVGIGTSSPIHLLQVANGNLGLYSNSYANTGLIRMYGTDGLEKYQQGLTTGGDFYQYTFTGLNHIFYTNNGSERMRITSGGDIIGYNNFRSTVGFNLYKGSVTRGGMYDYSSISGSGTDYSTTIFSETGQGIYFAGNGSATRQMTLTSSGNLLIGTTTDNGAKLNVNGTIRSNDTNGLGLGSIAGYRRIQYGSDNATSFTLLTDGNAYAGLYASSATFSSSVTANGLNALGSTLNNGNAIRLYRAGLTEMAYIGWTNENTNNSTWYFKSSNGNPIGFSADGTNQQVTIATSGNLLVGTTTDNGARLQVSGAIYASDELYLDNGKYLRFRRSSGNLSIQTLGIPSGTDDVRLLTTGDFNIINGSLTNLMTVKNSGNVGIGTTNPLQKLHITQAADTAYPTLGTGKGALFIAGDTNLYGLYVGINTNDGNTYFQAMRNNSATAYNITMQAAGGNVLIGNTSAYTSRLTVQATAGNRPAIKAGFGVSAGNGYWVLGDNYTLDESLTSYGIDYSSGDLVLGSIVAPSTTTSGAFISTQAQFGNLGSAIRAGNSGNIYFFRGTSTSVVSIGGAKSMTESMRLNSSGNLLIGTTTDNSHKLRVNGTGYFDTGIKTGNPVGSTTNDWLLGRALVSGTSTPDRWIRVQIGNLYYDILAVYMGSV